MFKNQKTRNTLKVRESEKLKLRPFRAYQAPQASTFSVEGAGQENAYEGSEKNLGTAMLEAEYQKAKASMAFQNSRRFY
jgi:hypothetical protein